MDQHVRILGWLHLGFGVLGMAFAVFVGGVLGIAGAAGGGVEGALGMGLLGTFIVVCAAVFSAPAIIAGWGLLRYREWARILTIILSFLNLINIPFGTILGGYGLWALLNDETKALFRAGGPIGTAQNW